MALTIVTEPTIEPVTLYEIKQHLRLDSDVTTDEDDVLSNFIIAARDTCEKFQNRAYIDQTWDLVLDDWPGRDIITIPRPPLGSVTSITYYATGGTAATMTAGTYIIDKDSEPGRVSLGYGEVWPTTTLRPVKGIIVRFLAGYGSAASSVPTRVKQAIRLLVGHMYEHRENAEIKKLENISFGVDNLLTLDRIFPI